MMKTRIFSLVLALCMLLTVGAVLTACNGSSDPVDTTATDATQGTADTSAETTAPTAQKTDVKVMVLNGTTGFGIAPLMDKNAKGEAANNYTFSVETDAANITASLINGSVDMAALPTNAAANINAKKPGTVQVVAVNTLGVLYLMSSENEAITSMEDLRGKTVYCPAQNPSFIFTYLCKENGLVPGTDVTIDTTSYAQPADLRTALVGGKVDIAVLPEPMVTIAKSANDKLSVDLDLTAEWDKCATPGSLAQGCIVVRTAFASEHPEAVKAFLAEYETSITYVKENPADAGKMIAEQGVFAQAGVATKAIPNCNICFLAGEDMKAKLTQFYTVLHSVAPASVGNAVPGDDLYYIAE
ncbi:MAG: ABC transporter substrate-binding protein [Ruminococcaceae bacterium]|nr:ABC transporter substrate-binding protein [Oscillospiraceae bacterium]